MNFFYFTIGCIVASFVGVVIDRYPRGENFIAGRSHCIYCHQKLRLMDLIPIVSYLILRGKCRYCHQKIPIHYFFIEIIGGYFAIVCLKQYQNFKGICLFAIAMLLLTISFIDLKMMVIPNGSLCLFFILVMIYTYDIHHSFVDMLVGCLSVSLLMFVLTKITPDCFGGGDIKLMAVAGMLLGWKRNVLAFAIAIVLAGVYALYDLLKNHSSLQSYIAFAPYLSIGIWLSLRYGNQIIGAYLYMIR